MEKIHGTCDICGSDLQKFAEQSGLQVDGRSEFAYTDRLEQFSKFVRLDLELEINDLKDQLAKAEQLWQIAQGRCDGLEEKLAKAEQRVAEACALACEDVIGNTANDQRMIAAIDCSAMIHAGEWRKFMKEV